MLQKNGGDASGAVEELFPAAIQKRRAAPGQLPASQPVLQQPWPQGSAGGDGDGDQ